MLFACDSDPLQADANFARRWQTWRTRPLLNAYATGPLDQWQGCLQIFFYKFEWLFYASKPGIAPVGQQALS